MKVDPLERGRGSGEGKLRVGEGKEIENDQGM